MRDNRQITGRRGEDEACRYLRDRGHEIIRRNWRCGHLEIDIISLDPEGLHIVEVKSRQIPAPAAPQTNVGRRKMQKLTSAANAFLNSEARGSLPSDLEVFFDVVTVLFDGPKFEIEYYPQAFIPLYA